MLKLITIIFLFSPSLIWACPMCGGSMNNPNDTKLVYILMVFIALTYIPFYIIYSKIIKNRNANEFPIESTEE